MPFRDVIGHRQLVALLTRAGARATLPPSLIFAGPDGVGKATTAVALAQALNCERLSAGDRDSADWDACGTCASCRRIERAAAAARTGRQRAAVDCLLWLSPDEKGSIKIDVVRGALGRAGYRPLDGRTRVVIVEEAEALEVGAQQALLKMLEEPPPATRFVLVTSSPDALLPTIRSRCPQLRFGPLAATEIAAALVDRHGWPASEAQAAAALADGRLGRALDAPDSARQQAREVAAGFLEQVAASRQATERLEAAQTLLARLAPAAAEDGGARRARGISRRDLSARLEAVAALLRDIGVLTTRADRRRLAHADLSARLTAIAPAFAGDRLIRAFTVVDRALGVLDRNASPKVVADWLVFNL